jgi:hypothetical protein
MWNLRQKKFECSRFRAALENTPRSSVLPPALLQHSSFCSECRAAADEFSASHALLGALPAHRYQPSGWFVGRVMSTIAAREAELRRSLDTWSFIPRLAAKLAWVSALALLLAGTWLYERPRSAAHQNDATGESLFESAPSSSAPDDLLASLAERR